VQDRLAYGADVRIGDGRPVWDGSVHAQRASLVGCSRPTASERHNRGGCSSFALVARRSKARYVLGLSATVRKDGRHPIIFMQCGRCVIAKR
jgi:hypothetical protein